MKTIIEILISELPRKAFLVTAILATSGITLESTFDISPLVVGFFLLLLSAFFSSLYFKSQQHPFQVGIVIIMLGFLYPLAAPNDMAWWRLSCYSFPFWISGILFLSGVFIEKHYYREHFRAH